MACDGMWRTIGRYLTFAGSRPLNRESLFLQTSHVVGEACAKKGAVGTAISTGHRDRSHHLGSVWVGS